MKNFWGLEARNLLLSTFLKDTIPGVLRAGARLALILLVGLMAITAQGQNSFYTPQVLVGDWGSVTNDNSTNVPDSSCPNIAGFTPNAPVWYQWTAPRDGVVELDTIGSVDDVSYFNPLDTVMSVFTGNSISSLSQVAANDNLFPINASNNIKGNQQQASVTQFTESGSGDYGYFLNPGDSPVYAYAQPYFGPSHLRFNAVAGTTYYIAVDTEPDTDYGTFFQSYPSGQTTLQWAYQSSGVFRFATEDFDFLSNLPLYQTAETESDSPKGSGNADVSSTVLTYYPYNAPGVLVTVTRVAGSSGRCTVDYSTEDGSAMTNLPSSFLPFNDTPAVADVDYTPVSGTLVFDDYEMSKTILIPITSAGTQGSGGNTNNTYFGITLTNAVLDPGETGDVSQPRIDPTFSTAMIKILNNNADPYGPDMILASNNPVGSTNLVLTIAASPTNVIYNFEKSNYRVPADVSAGGSVSPWTYVAIYVHRSGTNTSGATLGYRINNTLNNDTGAGEEGNIYFPLQPGSDYAEATPPNLSASSTVRGRDSDFDLVNGTITFPSGNSVDANYQKITFTVTNSTLTKFNKDFKIEIYRDASYHNQTVAWLPGMVAETTVTILFNDQNPPAGSVDEFYNADFNNLMALPQGLEPQTTPQKDENPGVSGVVNSLVVLTNGETLVAGDFASYNGLTYPNGDPINDIVLVDGNGNLDSSFEPNSGANGPINSVVQTWDGRYIIGGNFTSFNGQQQEYLARLNRDGSADSSFAPALDGNVQSVVVQPDNKILIGGSFVHVNGQQMNGLARLNTDGTLDASFNPGTTLIGTVNAISLLPGIYTDRISNGSTQEDDVVYNVSPNAIGRATIKYVFPFPCTNRMQLIYGGNVIYDTGNGFNNRPIQISVPFGPGSTPLVIAVNPGSQLQTATNWSYMAIIQTNSDVMAGGDFTVNGQTYLNLARFTTNGLLDTTFSNIFSGADNQIHALAWQYDGKLVIGGEFTHYNGTALNGLARVSWDGSVDTGFYNGTGADDIVWNLNLQNDGTIYVGGQFTSINGTHRLGFARLNSDGTVDTSFMDTAYNQFAGLKKIFADDLAVVYASSVQSDSNVMIGGFFNQVGGGQADTNVCNSLDDEFGIQESFNDPNLWVEPKTRDGVRNRSSVARLIGRSTPGPGNIGLQLSSYSQDKSRTSLSVGLVRANGTLGPISANFSMPQGAAQGGTAQSGQDYSYNSTPPLYWIASQFTVHPSRERRDGLFGLNGDLQDVYGLFLTLADLPLNNQSAVTVSVINNSQSSGNQAAQFQLANPSGDNEFYLGGENIPVCSALGQSTAPFTIIDDTSQSGTFSYASTTFIATNGTVPIVVLRSNGIFGTVTMKCFATNGTAIAGTDYRGVTNQNLTFGLGTNITINNYQITILPNGLISTNFVEKTVNLSLRSISSANNTATFGISNAVLRLINPNFQGYLTFSAANYNGSESSGSVSFTVNRVAGSGGQVSVTYATTNETAVAGVSYVGMTNTLHWNGGDSSPRIVTIPLINSGVVGGNQQFGISLFNPTNSLGYAPALFYAGSPGSITNATVTITNDDSYGTLQFSTPAYLVAESGGYATLTVTRTGGAVGPASVIYATSDGSNAFANTNYIPASGVLSFASNQISASFNVKILNDGIQDPGNFFFNVTLSSPVNAALGTPTNAIVNILDASTYGWSPGSSNGVFNADISGDVFALALQTNGQVLVGGDFKAIDGAPDDYIGRLNTDGSIDPVFQGSASGPVQALVCQTDGNILLGGTFSTADGIVRNNIARLTTSGSLDTTFNPGAGANGAVNALAETFAGGARKIYVGGNFSEISSGLGNSSGYSPYFARLFNNGTLDTTFNTGFGLDGPVNAIAVYPTNSIYAGKVIVGGSFTHYNGITVNGIVRLNSDGSVDTGFNPGVAATNGAVNAITIQPDGRILVGGSFINFGGIAVNNFTRLNNDGSADTNFVAAIGAGANNTVNEITLQPDNRVLIVGQFSQVGGLDRGGVTRLLPTGANDLTINFGTGANGLVDAVVVQPSTGFITLGGAFTAYNGETVGHIVQIYGNSITGSGAFQFSAPSYQINENGFVAPITVLRTGGTSGTNADGSGNVSVNFTIDTNSSTAVAGVNYIPVSTTLVFAPGQTYETINVPILSTSITTTNSWVVYMGLSDPTPETILGSPSSEVPLNILNTNSAVSFQNPFPNVFETASVFPANITLIRTGFTNGSSSVEFLTTTNTGTGVPNVDYYPTNEIVTFNPGDAQANAQVLIISNSTLEKTIGLTITNPVNTIIYSPSNATLSVNNNVSAPGQLYFASANYSVNESGGNIAVTVLRTNGYSDTVTYGYTTLPGTALPGLNYVQTTNGTVTFPGSSTAEIINVKILTNNLPEAPVNFSINLTNSTGSVASIIDPTSTTVTIFDDVNTGFAFLNVTNSFEETNGVVAVLVARLGNTNNPVSIQFATTNGTAVAGVNYVASSGTLNFDAGQSLGGISITLMNNEDVTNEQFGLNLFGPSSGTQLVSPSNAVVVITPAGAGLTFTSPTNSVFKNVGSISIPVVCMNPSAEPVIVSSNTIPLSVNYSTTNGTAVAGQDYIAVSGTLVFSNGIATNTITIPIINNSLITGLRTFTVGLSAPMPVPPGELVPPTNEVITIIDSNSGLAFSSPNYSIVNGGLALITVVRTDNTNTVSTVNFATAGGTAVPNSDYFPTNGVLTFSNGQTSASFVINVIANSGVQPDKTILIGLSNPTNGVLTAPNSATLTIFNHNGSYVVPAGVALFSATNTPTGILQSGKQAQLWFSFRDAGGTNVSDLKATLLNANGVTSGAPPSTNGTATEDYGQLAVNGPSVAREFTVIPNGTNSQNVLATFALQDGAKNIGTNTFTLTLGTWNTTFYNTNAIYLPPSSNDFVSAIASPYPSMITVTNVGGVLVGTTVTLTNFTHNSPQSAGILVVSPAQQDTLIMAGVGTANVGMNNVTLIFSDAATNSLPSTTTTSTPITNGVYKPTQDGAIPNFP